jgi:hypothetical protein
VRRLTLREVNEQHGGKLPPDAVLRPDDHEEAARPAPPAKPKHRSRSERFAVLNAFADFTLAGLDRNEIAVWLLLFRDSRDGVARTSQSDLARRAGASDRTVRRALGRLRAARLVEVVRRGRLQTGPSAYRVRALWPGGP